MRFRNKIYSFDSKAESKRAFELLAMQDAMYIFGLEFQPEFVLQDSFRRNGKAHRAIKYISDFKYRTDKGVFIEDVTGKRTAEYQIKKKLFLKKYGDDYIFREVYLKNGIFEVKEI